MYTFIKEERLRHKKDIDRLFSEGIRFYSDPFLVIRISEPFDSRHPMRVLISVSKKRIRKAVLRNRMKRRIREAYRTHKTALYDTLNKNRRFCTLALIYNSGEIAEYKDVEEKIILILKRLQKEYEKPNQ